MVVLRRVIDFDGAGEPCNRDHVTHIELGFNQDQSSIQHVLHDVLCGQADGHARDSRRSQQRRQV